ncbi:MAG: hypothetical protein J3K34DRAFT_519920 [Monoraphidium minutum]|nr:MAG: hypothetical protein J3K34DRAFT_519920 [Monoraphidium minutum]
MYDCVCGFSAPTAIAFHGHVTASAGDPSTSHRLAGNNGRYSTRASLDSGAAAKTGGASSGGGGAPTGAAAFAKANRPAGAYPAVEHAGWLQGADSASELLEPPQAQQRRRSQQQRQQQQGAGGAVGAATPDDAWDSVGGWVREYVIGSDPPPPQQQQQQQQQPAAGGGGSGRGGGAALPLSTSSAGAAAPAAPAARHSFGASLRDVLQGNSWLSRAAGRAASSAVTAAVTAAATAAAAEALGGEGATWGGGGGAQWQQQQQQQHSDVAAVPGAVGADGRSSPLAWLSGASPHKGEGAQEGALAGGGMAHASPGVKSPARAASPAGGWLGRASRAATPAPADDGGAGPRGEAVRALLLWRDAGASWRALGAGLYLVLLLGSLPKGLDYLQITSMLPGVALLYLGYNLAKGPAASGYSKVVGASPDAVCRSLAAAEARGAARLGALAAAAAAAALGWAAGAAALAGRALRGRSATGTAWAGAYLWALLLLSELRLLPQVLLAMLAYASLFLVPWLFAQFRDPMDRVLFEGLQFCAALLAGCERASLALAAAAGAAGWSAAEAGGGSLVVRVSGGAAAAFAVLVWRVAAAA